MGDFAVSSRLGVRTIFNGTATTAADPAIALAAALHQERWNNTFRSLAPPPHPSQLYAERWCRTCVGRRVGGERDSGTGVRHMAWKNNVSGGRAATEAEVVSWKHLSGCALLWQMSDAARAALNLSADWPGPRCPEHPSKLLILKVLMTRAQILLSRNCQAAALEIAGAPVWSSLQLKWL